MRVHACLFVLVYVFVFVFMCVFLRICSMCVCVPGFMRGLSLHVMALTTLVCFPFINLNKSQLGR